MLAKQINQLITRVRFDREKVVLVSDLIETCARYYNQVVSANVYSSIGCSIAHSSEEYRIEMQEMDKHRRNIHTALSMCLRAVDRLCEQHSMPPLYGGNYEDWFETSRFAKSLVDEYFEAG